MKSINTDEASNAAGVSGFDSKIEIAPDEILILAGKSLVWLTFAAMVGLTASVTLEHLLFPHLTSWSTVR